MIVNLEDPDKNTGIQLSLGSFFKEWLRFTERNYTKEKDRFLSPQHKNHTVFACSLIRFFNGVFEKVI